MGGRIGAGAGWKEGEGCRIRKYKLSARAQKKDIETSTWSIFHFCYYSKGSRQIPLFFTGGQNLVFLKKIGPLVSSHV